MRSCLKPSAVWRFDYIIRNCKYYKHCRAQADSSDKNFVTDDEELRPVWSSSVDVSYAPESARRVMKQNNFITSNEIKPVHVPHGNMNLFTKEMIFNGFIVNRDCTMFVANLKLTDQSLLVFSESYCIKFQT